MNRFANYYKKIFSQEYIDRTISGGIKSQLTLLLVTIATALAIFFIIVMLFSIQLHGHEEWGERLWAVYNNFVDPGNQIEETAWPNRILVGLISISGSVLLGGVLISTISNIIERRVGVVYAGRMTYRNIKNHYVLIGFNELSINMIRELYDECPSARILLMSGMESATVRHRIQSALPVEVERQVLVYFGNIESIEELQRLNIESAIEVYVLGDEERYGRDAKNIAIVHLVSTLRGKCYDGKMMPVYVQFDSIPSYSNIQKMNLPPEVFCIEGKPNIFFRPFNLHENLARQLWSLYGADCERRYDPLDYRPISITQQPDGSWSATSQDYVHLVIVGFNRVGRSLLLEALRICHYANYDDRLPADERIRTRITLVDREMEAQKDYFKAQFPYIESQIDDIEVEYCHDDICSTAMRTRLQQWAQNKHCMLTVAICVHDPDLSLSLGLNLPHEVYQYQCRVLIRQEFNNDLSSMVDDENTRNFCSLVFGMVDRGIKKNILQDKLALYVNYLYDCCYADESLKQKEVLKKMYESYGNHSADFILMNHQAQYLWNKLSEPLRWANRYQLDAYSVFCRTLGYGIRRSDHSPAHISESMFNEDLPAQVLYLLVRMEKYRWNAERTVAGWRRAKVKDKVFLQHPLIMPFSELLQKYPEEVEKDADVIYNLPYILALGGYELYRLAD